VKLTAFYVCMNPESSSVCVSARACLGYVREERMCKARGDFKDAKKE